MNLKPDVIYFITYGINVFLKEHGGDIQMVLDDDQKTWLPYISQKGKLMDLFVWIYDSLYNLEEGEYPTISAGYSARSNNFFKNK